MQSDRRIAQPLRLQHRVDLVHGRRFGVAEEGCTEQAHPVARKGLDRALGRLDLDTRGGDVGRAEVGVGIGVIADLVPLTQETADEAGFGDRVFADQKKGRGDVVRFEDVEDLRRPHRVGPVVERERDQPGMVAAAIDNVGGGQLRELLIGNEAVRVGGDGTQPGLGRRRHLKDFAAPLDLHVGAGGNLAQAAESRLRAAPPHRPQRRILCPQPPQRGRIDAKRARNRQLISRGGCVQHPHFMVFAAVIIVSVGRVPRSGIPAHGRIVVARLRPGLFDRQLVRRLGTRRPVIGIVADAHDHLGSRYLPQPRRQRRAEPRFGCDRAGSARLPMLVVCHQEYAVRCMGVGGIIPVRIVERGGDADQPAVWRKGRVHLAQEGEQVAVRCRGHLLKVEDDAVAVHCGDIVGQLAFKRGAFGRVSQQRRQSLAVPVALVRVLDHRQHQRPPGHRRAQDRGTAHVGLGRDRVIGAVDREPVRHHPVELADVALQAGRAVVCPGGIKPRGQLRRGGVAHAGGHAPAHRRALRPVEARTAHGAVAEASDGDTQLMERQRRLRRRREQRYADQHDQHHDRYRQQASRPRKPGRTPAAGIIKDRPLVHSWSI